MAPMSVAKAIHNALDDSYYTKDCPKIFQYKWHPVFVYGTLKSAFNRNFTLEGGKFLGTAFTRNRFLSMYRTNGSSSFPIVMEAKKAAPGAIQGEVYIVPPDIITKLDFIESNGMMYQRSLRTVDLYDRSAPDKSRHMAAWMYVAHPDFWKDHIKEGRITLCPLYQLKHRKDFKYYIFKKEKEKHASMRNM
jgi:gamma-glutamylcyclotransferase (GGCT)/AIG2-like uncharacterized protein YtfP